MSIRMGARAALVHGRLSGSKLTGGMRRGESVRGAQVELLPKTHGPGVLVVVPVIGWPVLSAAGMAAGALTGVKPEGEGLELRSSGVGVNISAGISGTGV